VARPRLERYRDRCPRCGNSAHVVMDHANGGYYVHCFVCGYSDEGNDMEET